MKKNLSLDQWLDAVSVHGIDDYHNEVNGGQLGGVLGWYGVSTDDAGGIIAYFNNENDAFHYRLDYINRKLNPLK